MLVEKDPSGVRFNSLQYPFRQEEQEKQEIARKLAPLVARGFMQPMSEEIYQDTYEHVINCSDLTIVECDDVPVAFSAVSRRFGEDGTKICHLEGIIVDEEFRGSGMASFLLEKAMRETGADALAFHTQSKAMLKLGMKLSERDDNLAMRVSPFIGTRNQMALIDQGRYGGACLYGDTERFSHTAINWIDWRNGDALIYAGWIR